MIMNSLYNLMAVILVLGIVVFTWASATKKDE